MKKLAQLSSDIPDIAIIMSDATDTASLAGTWVGAGIGLFGIIAVVGPLLVWWASRTERHKALMAIGRKNNGYLSDGIPIWPGIRFWQSSHPPSLREARPFAAREWRDFDLARLRELPESKATWVQFGACLQAYGLNLRRGKDLLLEDGLLKLPVHKKYLFTFLVLGRYQKKPRGSIISAPATDLDRRLALKPTRGNIPRLEGQGNGLTLYGLTGSFKFETRRIRYEDYVTGEVQFVGDLRRCPTNITADKISVSTTMILALGFLPLPSNQLLCCTIGKYEISTAAGADTSSSEDDSSSSDGDVYRGHSERTPYTEEEELARKRLGNLMIKAVELQERELDDFETLLDLGGLTKEVWMLCPMDNIEGIQERLQELAAMTFVPPEEPFVRIYTNGTGEERQRLAGRKRRRRIDFEQNAQELVFVDRKSAQLFALAHLKLPWSPNSYILGGGHNRDLVQDILTQAAPASIRFILRLKKNPSVLHLRQSDLAKILSATDKLLQHDLGIPQLCELDDVLESLQHPLSEVSLMVGVLLLTNVEYRELVYQSIRHITTATSSIQNTETVLEFDTGNVIVAGAFGIRHTFVVDLASLRVHLPEDQRAQVRSVKIDFATVLLASFKAYLRSVMATKYIDGSDIEDAMIYEDDVYHIS